MTMVSEDLVYCVLIKAGRCETPCRLRAQVGTMAIVLVVVLQEDEVSPLGCHSVCLGRRDGETVLGGS